MGGMVISGNFCLMEGNGTAIDLDGVTLANIVGNTFGSFSADDRTLAYHLGPHTSEIRASGNLLYAAGVSIRFPGVEAPAAPRSGAAVRNPNPYQVQVFVSGGSGATQVLRNGQIVLEQPEAPLPHLTIILAPGDTITMDYSGEAPVWRWHGFDQ